MSRHARALSAIAVAAAAVALSAAAVAPSVGALARTSVAAGSPGVIGTPFTIAGQVTFDGDKRAYSMASDASGRTYIAWIASPVNGSTSREVYLCELPLNATACAGGTQHIALTDPSTSAGLRLLVTPGGTVTIVWYHTDNGGGEIAEATAPPGGALSSEHDVASAPVNGFLLDAEFGPGGSIWTVAMPESGTSLSVRPGVTNPAVTVAVPSSFPSGVGYAQLAFSGSTPILGVTENAGISTPAAYAYEAHGSWTHFTSLPGTWTVGTDLGLTHTSSGVRLTSYNDDYFPVVAKWNGHGFTRPAMTGDRNPCAPNSHDTVTDASGRLADVGDECGQVAVANLADTTHASILRFPTSGTTAGGGAQISTVPRGYAWVAWSTQYSPASSADGDRLRVVEVRLPGLRRRVTKHGKHGAAVLTGPASCLPAVSIGVGVAGHAKHGWKVKSRTVKLGAKKLGKSLDGASLKAGKSYKIRGSVVFSKGHSRSTVTAILKFRACPNP